MRYAKPHFHAKAIEDNYDIFLFLAGLYYDVNLICRNKNTNDLNHFTIVAHALTASFLDLHIF